jgi:RNA polymerase sigma-70 factor (ECF subfamily)
MLGPQHSDLEDAVQNALVAFHDALPRYRFESSVLHYAVRITFRTTHGFRRRLRLLAQRFDLLGDRDDLASAETSNDAERSEALRKLLLRLPRIQAETLLMHFALGYPIAEVAAIDSVSVNTVKTRLRLGKDTLRRRIVRDPTLRLVIGGEA